jgi:hypothetical protein
MPKEKFGCTPVNFALVENKSRIFSSLQKIFMKEIQSLGEEIEWTESGCSSFSLSYSCFFLYNLFCFFCLGWSDSRTGLKGRVK